jgi:hypothetical protein
MMTSESRVALTASREMARLPASCCSLNVEASLCCEASLRTQAMILLNFASPVVATRLCRMAVPRFPGFDVGV